MKIELENRCECGAINKIEYETNTNVINLWAIGGTEFECDKCGAYYYVSIENKDC